MSDITDFIEPEEGDWGLRELDKRLQEADWFPVLKGHGYKTGYDTWITPVGIQFIPHDKENSYNIREELGCTWGWFEQKLLTQVSSLTVATVAEAPPMPNKWQKTPTTVTYLLNGEERVVKHGERGVALIKACFEVFGG